VRDELASRLKAIRGPRGEEWQTVVIKPQEHYPVVNGDYPDLMVYLMIYTGGQPGQLGYGSLYLEEMIPGRMTLFHDYNGIYILYDPASPGGRKKGARIIDIAPTVLKLLGGPAVPDLQGQAIS